VLIDTSTLLRTIQVRHPQYETVARAFETLPRRGRDLHIVPQNLVELWVVATRPVAQNGLGLSTTEAAAELMRLKSMFPQLPDTLASSFCIPPMSLLERTVHFFRGAAESVASLGLPVPLPVSASHARLNSPGVSNSREALNLLAFPASHARARPGAKIACSAV
jgi:hypothetical protein